MKKKILAYGKLWLNNYQRHGISTLAAESTYYMILAMVPFLVFALNIIMFAIHQQLDTVLAWLQVLPMETQEVLRPMIFQLLEDRSQAILSVGFLVALWSTSKGMNAGVQALNVILHTEERDDDWIWVYIKSLGLTILGSINGVISLFSMVYGKAILLFWQRRFGLQDEILAGWDALMTWVPLVFVVLFLTVFYRYAPNVRAVTKSKESGDNEPVESQTGLDEGRDIPLTAFDETGRLRWKKALAAAAVGCLLWVGSTWIYRFYITEIANLSNTYGPLVGLMIFFVWLNLSVKAVLIGLESIVTYEQWCAVYKVPSIKDNNTAHKKNK